MSKLKIVTPEINIIEKTSAELAGVFFDACRSSGMEKIKLQGRIINLKKYKNNPRAFARDCLEGFIPAAIEALTTILGRDTTPPDQKEIIYKALMERVNDEQLDMMAKTAGNLPEFEQTILYKKDDEKPKPIIVNSPKIDFDFDSKRTS